MENSQWADSTHPSSGAGPAAGGQGPNNRTCGHLTLGGVPEKCPTREIFNAYQSSRREMMAILFTDWWRTGRHEEFGVVALKQQVSYFASHELTHLPQIERLARPP